jgi:protein-S-isoprenylcysteine O-methyltransferase Ste14
MNKPAKPSLWSRFWQPNFKSPFWDGFWRVYRHFIWTMPLAFLLGIALREMFP